jgi:hypothetical protein
MTNFSYFVILMAIIFVGLLFLLFLISYHRHKQGLRIVARSRPEYILEPVKRKESVEEILKRNNISL